MTSPAVPLTDSTSASTATSITNPHILNVIRGLWMLVYIAVIILLVGLFVVGFSQPVSLDNSELPQHNLPQIIVDGYIVTEILLLVVSTSIDLVLSFMLMWRSKNERGAIVFSFVFMALAISNMSVQAEAISVSLSSFLAFLNQTQILIIFYLFPDLHFTPRWLRYPFVIFIIVYFIILVPDILIQTLDINYIVPIVLSGFIIGLGSFLYRYRRTNSLQRQQIKWLIPPLVLLPLIVFSWFMVFIFVPQPTSTLIQSVLWLLLLITYYCTVPIAIFMGILRYRLWDIDLVINRTLVYSVLTILLLIVFGVVIALVSVVIPQQGQIIGVVLATVAATILFNPARKAIQNLVDRYIYRLNFNLNELAAAQQKPQILNPGILSGKNLNGYEVRDVLGQGGMGEVYQGFGNGQTVAIKTMLPKIAQDPHMRTRFQREAQAGMQLDHPHIAKVYAQGEIDGIPYLVMDFIEGQDLNRYLKADGKLDEETAKRLLQDICGALDIAHQQGFVHRDLKPANIMIKPNGQAVLMDFGITKVADATSSLTGTGAIGTIDYMAPEQIMTAKTVDKRADIYALGVMVYEMLTGEKPFQGNAAQVMFAHLQQPPPDANDINEDIPRSVAKAIMQAMSKKPEERFESADSFLRHCMDKV
jgi:tRNA A-37 threonylcarbamoyl transferase component Bud32